MSDRLLSHTLYRAAWCAGLLALTAAGAAAARHHPVGLGVCVLIGAFFLLGSWDLAQMRRASAGLRAALDPALPLPDAAANWLASVPAALRSAVQQRLDGVERVALPGGSLAPALTGLLVLLGMLGTFSGLLLTLGGTAQALHAGTDLASLRSALGAPVQGLGLAFSASVAGVAASAMLGLMLALARRERALVQQQLDAALSGRLRRLTRPYEREASERQAAEAAQQAQAALVERIGQMADALAAQLKEQTQCHHREQQAAQARFHAEAQHAYRELAGAVDASLRTCLVESARQAASAWQPIAEATLAAMAREAGALQQQVGERVSAQLEGVGQRVEAGVQALLGGSRAALNEQIVRQAEAAQAAQQELLARLTQQQAGQMTARELAEAARLAAWVDALQQSGRQQQAQQQQLADALVTTTREFVAQSELQSRTLLAEVGALLQAAGEAPRAAVAMVAQLREQLVQSQQQDQAHLGERAELMRTLGAVLAALQQAAGEQRAAIDALLAGAAQQLEQAGQRFAAQSEASTGRLSEAAVQLAAGAAELGSLGEGFTLAVEGFDRATGQWVRQCAALEQQLAEVATRSDEQLGYYVAQARELIELCLGGQKQVLDALQGQPAVAHG